MQRSYHGLNWDEIPQERLNEKIVRQIILGDELMLVKLTMQAGAVVQRHSHSNEQMSYILMGRIIFTYGQHMEHQTVLGPGDVLHLPAHLPHAAECLEDTIDLDVFTPPRKDWINASGNAYFMQSDVLPKNLGKLKVE